MEIRISPLNQEHCQNIIEQCSEKIESMEELLAGNFPVAMKELFAGENGLFPKPSSRIIDDNVNINQLFGVL